jgi:hypothetical protein
VIGRDSFYLFPISSLDPRERGPPRLLIYKYEQKGKAKGIFLPRFETRRDKS